MNTILVLFLILFSINLQAAPRSVVFKSVSARGSYFLPLGTHAEAPTKIWLAPLGVEPGDIIGIRQVGKYNWGQEPEDWATGAVFLDANDAFIYAGPRSTAPNMPSFPDVLEDFALSTHPQSVQHAIHVPIGAVSILVSPTDTYNLDNSDPNGDYGIEIEHPYSFPIHLDIIQGTSNPDPNGDEVIDLIPGVNAEFKITTAPNTNVANSTLVLKDNSSGAQIFLPPSNLVTTLIGEVSFFANPVPQVAGFGGPATVTVTLKGSGNEIIAEKIVQVNLGEEELTYKIFQVIENPDIEDDGIIDLVEGKNADIVLKFRPNTSILKSTVTFEGISQPYTASTIATDAEGNFAFHIDPVPPSKVNKQSKILIQIRNSNNEVLSAREVSAIIWETKPIKIGFVKLKSPTNTYSVPNSSDTSLSITKGMALMKALFPVSDRKLKFELSPKSMNGTEGIPETQADRIILATLAGQKNRFFNNSLVSHVVGLTTSSYFNVNPDKKDTIGETRFAMTSMQAVAGYPLVIPHEMGHTYCIRYDIFVIAKECVGGNPTNAHNFDFSRNLFGFLNYTITELNDFLRGSRDQKRSLMVPEDVGDEGDLIEGKWFSKKEYLTLLRRNRSQPSRKFLNENRLLISAILDVYGNYLRHSTYILNSDREVTSDDEGELIAEAKDINSNLIRSLRFSTQQDLNFENEAQSIEIALPLTSDTAFIDIYREEKHSKNLLDRVVVPSDLIEQDLKYIPNQAFRRDPGASKISLTTSIARYRQYILNGDLAGAKRYFSGVLIPMLKDLLIDDFEHTSIMNSGLSELSELALLSYNKIHALEPSPANPESPFLRVQTNGNFELGSRNMLRGQILQTPSNRDMLFIHEAFFDGVRVQTRDFGAHFEADSLKLASGSHIWQVQMYLVNRKMWVAFQTSLISWNLEKSKLQLRLDVEKDPEEVAKLQQRVALIDRFMASSRLSIRDSMTTIGDIVDFRFEVL